MTKPPDGVKLLELTQEKALELWARLNELPGIFDDFSVNRPEMFFQSLLERNAVWLERTDGNGILYLKNVIWGLSASGHIVYWDKKLKGTEKFTLSVLLWLMENAVLQKVNLFLPDFVHTVRTFAETLGFKREGCIRRWSYSRGKTFDVYVYGITREEAYAKMEEMNGTVLRTSNIDIQPGEPGVRGEPDAVAEPATEHAGPEHADQRASSVESE